MISKTIMMKPPMNTNAAAAAFRIPEDTSGGMESKTCSP
jgi:hypothetical protein